MSASAETLLVASHLDTVPVDGMVIDPFDPVVEGDRVLGRGSCDTKAGMAALLHVHAPAGPLLCALAVQLRLLCNLLDGMVAVEGGLGGPTGALWNELPDRIADSVFIVALGMAAGVPIVGWAGALLAAVTAYIRTTGGALGFAQDFSGVQSKPKRMFVMTVGCLVAAAWPWWANAWYALQVAAWIILVGSAITCVTRTLTLARRLRERAAATAADKA